MTHSLRSMYLRRTDILGSGVLVLVGLLLPLVPLFEYLIRSALELYRLLCIGQNFPLIGKVAYTNDTILEKYVFTKYIV
jgi:hypothetical protein